MEEQQKKLVDATRESEYFDFMVEAKIKEKLREMPRRYRWLIGLLVLLNLVILAVFGYEAQNLRQAAREAEAKSARAGELAARAENFLANLETTEKNFKDVLGLRQQFLDMQDSILKDRRKFNEDARRSLEDMITRINDLKIKQQSEELSQRLAEIKRQQESVNDTLARIQEMKETLEPQVRVLSRTSAELKKVASVRYIYVERGDRYPEGDEFRPVVASLPFSNNSIEVRFFKQKKEEGIKKAWVDVLLNGKMLFKDMRLTDRENINSQIKSEFVTSDSIKYKLYPEFIYLPPNPVLAYAIPDFIIFRVQMLEEGVDPNREL